MRKFLRTSEINTSEVFASLFPRSEEMIAEISESIRDGGLHEATPIILGDWGNGPVVIDGHTRLEAAKRAGVQSLNVVILEFPDEERALEYCIRSQVNRRNLTDGDLLYCVQRLDKRMLSGTRTDLAHTCARLKGKSSAHTADLLNMSSRKVEQIRTILDSGDAGIVEKVRQGDMSIRQAYDGIRTSRRKTKSLASDSVRQEGKSDTGPTAPDGSNGNEGQATDSTKGLETPGPGQDCPGPEVVGSCYEEDVSADVTGREADMSESSRADTDTAETHQGSLCVGGMDCRADAAAMRIKALPDSIKGEILDRIETLLDEAESSMFEGYNCPESFVSRLSN